MPDSFSQSQLRTCPAMARLHTMVTSWLLIAAIATLALPRGATAAATSMWGPICGRDQPDSPPSGAAFQLWSSPSTWNLPGGAIPGVGTYEGKNVTIPCDKYISLDVPLLRLETLDVQGTLKVEDKGPTFKYNVTAAFIVVQGNLLIGSRSVSFRSKIVFTLVDTPTKAAYVVTRPALDGFVGPFSLENKVFAVVGGRMACYGFPVASFSEPAWTRLSTTAAKGTNKLTVQVPLAWPVGSKIFIASSDYKWGQAEELDIVSISSNVITVAQTLQYMHYGGTVSAGVGRTIDESTEVGLLTRNILIQGEVDTADPLIGGHFIVFKTQHPRGQLLDGIEFINMGQQGRLGKYPVHFHLCRDARPSMVTRCSVWQSTQRCYTVHGTHWLPLKGNVCYKSQGHGYHLEDGVEMNNTWDGNLGANIDPVTRLINSGTGGATETDDEPSVFWISNPANTFINNAAAGARDSGFWFELMETVLGPSAGYPEAVGLSPRATKLGVFDSNTAHSNRKGFRSYPSGWKTASNTPGGTGTLKNFRAWKNREAGISLRRTAYVTVDGAQLADNLQGIHISLVSGIYIINSLIFGETQNYGNPLCMMRNWRRDSCPSEVCPSMDCGPVSPSCMMPLDNSTQLARSLADFRYTKSSGVTISGYNGYGPFDVVQPEGSHILDTVIAGFPSECNVPRACVMLNSFIPFPGEARSQIFLPTHSVKRVTCVASTSVLFAKTKEVVGPYVLLPEDQGEQGQYLTLWDEDGSLTKRGPGYLVKNTTSFLANKYTNNSDGGFANCFPDPSIINGMNCPGTCYRSVLIEWRPKVAIAYNPDGPAALRITRASDGAVITVHHRVYAGGMLVLWAAANLLTRQTYLVEYILEGTSGVPPPVFKFGFMHAGLQMCDGGITLQFVRPGGQQFAVAGKTVPGPCVPATKSFTPNATTYGYTCVARRSVLQASLASAEKLVSVATVAGGPGCSCV